MVDTYDFSVRGDESGEDGGEVARARADVENAGVFFVEIGEERSRCGSVHVGCANCGCVADGLGGVGIRGVGREVSTIDLRERHMLDSSRKGLDMKRGERA